ncbi:MAG: hypothetical protein KME16_28340 [Scytolyngbya sp. HA4215-MV1]|nr:hypothetical protein [Scytolyngbya sp. HA4215-MV1]
MRSRHPYRSDANRFPGRRDRRIDVEVRFLILWIKLTHQRTYVVALTHIETPPTLTRLTSQTFRGAGD